MASRSVSVGCPPRILILSAVNAGWRRVIKAIFKKETQSGWRLLVLILISIGLMVLDKQFAAVDQVRAALSVPLLPLQYIVSWPIQFIDKVGRTISSHDALVQENIDLKAEHLLLKAQIQRLLAVESENNQLKSLMSSSSNIKGKMLIANLLAIDIDPYIHQIVLDKGSKDNVYVGQPVLDANGVLGQVIQVGPLSCRVLLINDPRSGIPVRDNRSGLRAVAMGDGFSGQLRLVHVIQNSDIKPGDILMTSGLGEHYPEGYPVGKVAAVKQDPGASFASISVQPFANLDKNRQVLLVWGVKK